MDIDQLKSNWQQQLVAKSLELPTDWEKNMRVLEDKMMTVEKNVKSRTLYGAIGFVLIIVSMSLLGYLTYLLNHSLILLLGTVSFVVVLAITMLRYFIVRRRYNKDDNTLNIKGSLQHKLSQVEGEIAFYHSILWKIMAPMSIGFVLTLVGANASLQVYMLSITFYILCCYFSYVYNKHYVAKNLIPVKDEIVANLEALV